MKKTNFWLIAATLTSAIILPLINIIGVWSLFVWLRSDVKSSELAVNLLGITYNALTMLCAYAVSACVGYAVAMQKNRVAVLLTAFLALPVAYYAITAMDMHYAIIDMDMHFYGDRKREIVVYNLVNCLVEMLRLTIVAFVVFLSVRETKYTREMKLFSFGTRLSRTAFIAPGVIVLKGVVSSVSETLRLIAEGGAFKTFTSVMELIMPYIESIAYFIVGYFVTFFLYKLFEKQNKK